MQCSLDLRQYWLRFVLCLRCQRANNFALLPYDVLGLISYTLITDHLPFSLSAYKAFAMGNDKGKAKELSPQDAALLIQMNYRAHLAHRSQVLRCLRDLAVAKAKLKELRSLFYNLNYRRRCSHDHEERQRFSEKIIVLLLTVDALEVSSFMICLAFFFVKDMFVIYFSRIHPGRCINHYDACAVHLKLSCCIYSFEDDMLGFCT
jgi:hypothetical protein